MPIYEYQCDSCGARLEKLQKITDSVLKDCPKCKKASLKKMISATSFRLKGTGWYETDFKTGNKQHATEEKVSHSDETIDTPTNDKKRSAENSDSNSKSNSDKSVESLKSSATKETSL